MHVILEMKNFPFHIKKNTKKVFLLQIDVLMEFNFTFT